MTKRTTFKALAFPAYLLAAMSMFGPARAADLPRVDLAKPLKKELGRDLVCCDGPKADLRLQPLGGEAPQDGRPNSGFCGGVLGNSHSVVFSVINLGSATTPATTALVDFAPWGRVDVAVPPLAPGGGTRGYAIIPSRSLEQGDRIARFQISVDPGNAIAESNEGNNKARSYCRNAVIRNIPGR